VFNHGTTLAEVVLGAQKLHETVIVVDDGSSDLTADMLHGLGALLVRHPSNLGKGAAILSGAEKARELGMTHIVTVDADGQHDPNDVHKFISMIEEFPNAIIVGKRDLKRADAPRASRIGRGVSNFWLYVETGKKLGDAQSGFRAYPVYLFQALTLKERGFAFEIEVLVKAAWADIDLKEINISAYYPAGKKRISHFRLFKDNVKLSRLNAKLFFRSLIPIPHKKLQPFGQKHG
jgi:glycosyltransferase involved in cell wall biosynthesis